MSSRYREWDPACKVYIGNLKENANKSELEELFTKYGKLRNIWVARNPPGFAFAEFEDPRDAEDAVRGLDGTRCCGSRITVEMSSGKSRRNRERGGDRDRNDRDRANNFNRRRSPPYRRPSPPPRRVQRQYSRSRSRSPIYRGSYNNRDRR